MSPCILFIFPCEARAPLCARPNVGGGRTRGRRRYGRTGADRVRAKAAWLQLRTACARRRAAPETFSAGRFTESASADAQPPALSGAPPSSVRLDGEDTATRGVRETNNFLRERTLLARTASGMDARDRSLRAGRLCGQPSHRHDTILYIDMNSRVSATFRTRERSHPPMAR